MKTPKLFLAAIVALMATGASAQILGGGSTVITSPGGGAGGSATNVSGGTFNNVILTGNSKVSWVTYTVGITNAMYTDIQTAINDSINATITNGHPKGLLLFVGPGDFNSNGPPLTLANTALQALVIQGSGEISTKIHGASNVLQTTGNLGSGEGARYHLYVRDLALITDSNTTNPIVRLEEAATRRFQNVYFSYNGYITNKQWGISTAPSTPNPVTQPLSCYAVELGATDENSTEFLQCNFNGLGAGIAGSAAHLYVTTCQFQDIGLYNGGTTNGWPKTNQKATGAAICMVAMGHEAHILNSTFVGCRVNIALLGTAAGGQYTVDNPYFEPSAPDSVANFAQYLLDNTGASLIVSGDSFDAGTTANPPTANSSDYTSVAGSASPFYVFGGWSAQALSFGDPTPAWGMGGTNMGWFNTGTDRSFETAFGITSDKILTAKSTSVIPTNTANFTLDTSNPSFNTLVTNGNQRIRLHVFALMTSTNGLAAVVRVAVDQDANNVYEGLYRTALTASTSAGNNTIIGVGEVSVEVQPNGRYYVTNMSVAPSTATIDATQITKE